MTIMTEQERAALRAELERLDQIERDRESAARAMLAALKGMCDEAVGVTAAQWKAAYDAIAAAEAAGIKAED